MKISICVYNANIQTTKTYVTLKFSEMNMIMCNYMEESVTNLFKGNMS